MKKIVQGNWPYFLLLPFVLAAVAGWFVLPDELALRSGEGGTVPKLVGLLGPVAMAALGGSLACRKGSRRAAGAILLVLAAVLVVMVFAWNL